MILGSDDISTTRLCNLLEINKSTFYYKPVKESALTIELMHMIDEIFTKDPTYGSRRIGIELLGRGYRVNRKRILNLMHKMAISPIYPKRRLSQGSKEHVKYPYLLRGLIIDCPNMVWSTDITYIKMEKGFMYLMAIMDWYSRYVVSWSLSNTLDVGFCLEALKDALGKGKPMIFNTDQGTQFTSLEFVSCLTDNGIKISMDGRGRAFDNIFIERLWRTVKYEDIYIKGYETGNDLWKGLRGYFHYYNTERIHQGLGYAKPIEVYCGRKKSKIVAIKGESESLGSETLRACVL